MALKPPKKIDRGASPSYNRNTVLFLEEEYEAGTTADLHDLGISFLKDLMVYDYWTYYLDSP